jgi:hypothetical protein
MKDAVDSSIDGPRRAPSLVNGLIQAVFLGGSI